MKASNGEWRTVLRLGDEPGLETEWDQRLNAQEDWFGRVSAGYGMADTGQGTWYFILGKPWSLP